MTKTYARFDPAQLGPLLALKDANTVVYATASSNLWSILVAGTSVTTTHPFTNDRAYAHAFAG